MCYGGDTGTSFMVIGFRIYYTGAAWAVDANVGSINGAGDLNPTWNGTTDALEIDLSDLGTTNRGFSTQQPVAVVSATCDYAGSSGSDANFTPQARVVSVKDLYIRFYDEVTGAQVTTEAAQMDCQLILYGVIA